MLTEWDVEGCRSDKENREKKQAVHCVIASMRFNDGYFNLNKSQVKGLLS